MVPGAHAEGGASGSGESADTPVAGRLARLINERLAPVYLTAMKAGAKAWEEKLGGVPLDDSDRAVQNWIRNRTAGSERVCPKCGALNGKVVGFDESFDIGGREMFPGMHETPPAHPHCRCVVQYKETAAPARGLKSGEGQRKAPDHPVPQELGRIDFTDKNMVQSTIEHFESQIVAQKVENAIVITREGRVVRCVGHFNGVYPDEDIGDELRGAVVTHNHPIGSNNEYLFSELDFGLFEDEELSVLRGIDEKYIYELSRFTKAVDHIPSLDEVMRDKELYRHGVVATKAKERGYGYRRWKR